MDRRSDLTPFRALVATMSALLVMATLLAAPSGGDLANEPFAADGTVTDATASADPITTETDGVFRLGNPGFVGSPSTQPGVDANGEITVYTTANTRYYKDTGGGSYIASGYDSTVVEGALIRVNGRRVLEAGAYRFIATYVWNGPPAGGGGGGGKVPQCGQAGDLANKPFVLHGTVGKRRVHVPCTNIGDQAGGFALGALTFIFPGAASSGIAAWGGKPDIYATNLTTYFLDGVESNFDTVVKSGLDVRVFGTYQAVGGIYLFVAERVVRFTTPPTPDPFTNLAVSEDLVGVRTGDTTYTGTSYNGGFFGGGNLAANLEIVGNTVNGQIELVNPVTGDELTLAVSGTVVAHVLDATVTAVEGSSRFFGSEGTGSLDGLFLPPEGGLIEPQSFNAHLSINVKVPNPT